MAPTTSKPHSRFPGRAADVLEMDSTCKNPDCEGGTVVPTGTAGGLGFTTQPTGVCDKCRAIHRQGDDLGWFLISGEVVIAPGDEEYGTP
jgi:hypothetical protein